MDGIKIFTRKTFALKFDMLQKALDLTVSSLSQTCERITKGVGSTMRAPRQQDQQSRHRFRILNSLIFKAVSDLLQSAQVSRDLQRYSPEISKVSLVPDFSSCHVFWKSSGESERDQLVQRALDRNGPSIRYLIMSQQIMGGVPPLVFLKDKQLAIMEEVDRLLLLADTGPDLPEIFPDDRHSPLPAVDGAAGSSSVHPSLFGVDHEVLNRQIIEWRLSTGERHHMPPEFTQEQLAVLEQHRKQQIIRKRKKKTLSLDDGVTPKQLLLPQHINITPQFHSERQESEEDGAFKQEEAQLLQLMSEKEMV
ncbi:putative ribosome-binding factor A, mitochondrial isoform X2 [Lampris incognitus]|uniref:putative ribosome-binding factor A, mitochondrial isoform X2 n=1 Tax=Lampris incognitus TaxID=2546036 RepID=UPI0024B61B46|nr:putative ribosome-binding factor A, mitochondrial isoform X2 [Lampris incognitus]